MSGGMIYPEDAPPPSERPECPRCGCNAYDVVGESIRWGQAVQDRACGHCGHRWTGASAAPSSGTPDNGDGEGSGEGGGVVWTMPRCPSCRSHDVPVTRTVRRSPPSVHWRKCTACGAAFKSVGE